MAVTPPILPQHSIRGIGLGLTRAAVVARLGRPSHVRHGTTDLGPFTELRFRGLVVVFAFDQGVSEVESTTAADRTAGGAGVGSTEAQIRAAVPKLRCETESGVRHCHLGAFRAGKIVTDLFLRRGRVWRVVVGRVLD
jgi:hypothetical protein